MSAPLYRRRSDSDIIDIVFAGTSWNSPLPANSTELLHAIDADADPQSRRHKIAEIKRQCMFPQIWANYRGYDDKMDYLRSIAAPLLSIDFNTIQYAWAFIADDIVFKQEMPEAPVIVEEPCDNDNYSKQRTRHVLMLCEIAKRHFAAFDIGFRSYFISSQVPKLCDFILECANTRRVTMQILNAVVQQHLLETNPQESSDNNDDYSDCSCESPATCPHHDEEEDEYAR